MKKFEDATFFRNNSDILSISPVDPIKELEELDHEMEKVSENYHRMEKESIRESYQIYLD